MLKKTISRLFEKLNNLTAQKSDFNQKILLLFERFQNVLEKEQSNYTGELGVIKHYANSEVIASYQHLLKPLIADRELNYSTTTGVDLGCWLGLSTFMLSQLGAKKVIGLDVDEKFIQTASLLKEKSKFGHVSFALIEGGQLGTLPLENSSVDWVLANDSFSNALPSRHEVMVQEIFRILKPGGTFYFSDNNNPNHLETKKRLRQTYYDYEIGDGSINKPNGTYSRLRQNIIEAKFNITDPDMLERLCKATIYLWGDKLIETVSILLDKPQITENNFEPDSLRVPIHPVTGSSIGAVTDPIMFREILTNAGFTNTEMHFSTSSGESESFDKNNIKKSGRFYLISKK